MQPANGLTPTLAPAPAMQHSDRSICTSSDVQMLDSIAVFALLNRAVESAGSARAWAAHHKISPGYVGDVLASRRQPGRAILRALGLRKIIRFVPISG